MYNLHNLSQNVFGECDVFHVNSKWGALPLGGPGGIIAFVDVSLEFKHLILESIYHKLGIH